MPKSRSFGSGHRCLIVRPPGAGGPGLARRLASAGFSTVAAGGEADALEAPDRETLAGSKASKRTLRGVRLRALPCCEEIRLKAQHLALVATLCAGATYWSIRVGHNSLEDLSLFLGEVPTPWSVRLQSATGAGA